MKKTSSVEGLAIIMKKEFDRIEKRDQSFLNQFQIMNSHINEMQKSMKVKSQSEVDQDIEIMDLDLRVKALERKTGISR